MFFENVTVVFQIFLYDFQQRYMGFFVCSAAENHREKSGKQPLRFQKHVLISTSNKKSESNCVTFIHNGTWLPDMLVCD